MKVLQGSLSDELKQDAERIFRKVRWIKPQSSRKESKELYMLCQSFTVNLQKHRGSQKELQMEWQHKPLPSSSGHQ